MKLIGPIPLDSAEGLVVITDLNKLLEDETIKGIDYDPSERKLIIITKHYKLMARAVIDYDNIDIEVSLEER